MGCDPAQIKMAADRIVSTTGIVAQPQLIAAYTIGPNREISNMELGIVSSTQAFWYTHMPSSPF